MLGWRMSALHLPGCDTRHTWLQPCNGSHGADRRLAGAARDWRPTSSWRACVILLALGGAVLAVPCLLVAIALYEEGAFDSAPNLPSFARPVDANQLLSEKM